MISIIKKLMEKGFAYRTKDDDIYFRTKHFREYGKLSHQPLEDLEAGARISIGETKEDPMDFALWKSAKPNEPYWQSPWGKGRPGWHIECSAMANKYLGKTIDIHCGGQDLIFLTMKMKLHKVNVATVYHLLITGCTMDTSI